MQRLERTISEFRGSLRMKREGFAPRRRQKGDKAAGKRKKTQGSLVPRHLMPVDVSGERCGRWGAGRPCFAAGLVPRNIVQLRALLGLEGHISLVCKSPHVARWPQARATHACKMLTQQPRAVTLQPPLQAWR